LWGGASAGQTQVASHLKAVHKYNLKKDLSIILILSGPPMLAEPREGSFFARGQRAASCPLPFVYSNEVWTGIEYQVASHLILMGLS